MSERRGTGEGAVYRRPDGLWVAAVELPRGLDGKRRRRIVKARTKREVLARLEQVRKHASEGVVPDPATTVAAYLCWWLDNACGQLKPATLANYRITVSRHVKPYLGAVRLAQLSPAHVRTMLTGLESAGYSANTRRLARSVLRRALGLAERDGLVARNVAAFTDGPSVAGTRLDDALDAAQAARVLEVASGDRLEALAALVLTLGLRRGEALGLRWTDVDLDAKTLTVGRTLARVPGQGLVTTRPRTTSGRDRPGRRRAGCSPRPWAWRWTHGTPFAGGTACAKALAWAGDAFMRAGTRPQHCCWTEGCRWKSSLRSSATPRWPSQPTSTPG